MATVATFENAKAAFNIGREDAKRGRPSRESEWDNPGLAKAYAEGRASVEHRGNT